jgi:molybdopterin-guanine dinucleotide biosynthesis protein A
MQDNPLAAVTSPVKWEVPPPPFPELAQDPLPEEMLEEIRDPVEKMPCVVLAGGFTKLPDGSKIQTALVKLKDRALLEFALDAFCATPELGSIIVVGIDEPGKLEIRRNVRFLPNEGLFTANLARGVEAAKTDGRIMIAAGDAPFLTPAALQDFIQNAPRVEFAYPICRVEACYAKYPGLKRTAVSLREGRFTGGNAILADGAFMRRIQPLIGRVFASRKNPFGLARIFGVGFLLRLLLMSRGISLRALEQKAGQILDASVAVYETLHPELATDIDKLEEFELAEKYL